MEAERDSRHVVDVCRKTGMLARWGVVIFDTAMLSEKHAHRLYKTSIRPATPCHAVAPKREQIISKLDTEPMRNCFFF